jgi:hypothetical protein
MKKNGKGKEFTGVTWCGEETVAGALPLCEKLKEGGRPAL